MIVLIFALLWGSLLSLLLCAPYGYYPLFIIITLVSLAAFFISRRFFKPMGKILLPFFLIIFTASYSLCSYIIFKPSAANIGLPKDISMNKKAVIFYCEGEMEKYTPYYANYFIGDKPLLLKPIYAMKIKHVYRELKVNTKNRDLLNVAMDVKNSLLNYKPYYFYIAFSGYFPGISNSLQQAIEDGCGEIIILNYSSDANAPEKVSRQINFNKLLEAGIKIKWTKPIYESSSIVDLYAQRVRSIPFKPDAVMIFDETTNTATELKNSILQYGYRDSQVIISNNVSEAIGALNKNESKSLLYISLGESSSGIRSEYDIPREFNNYSGDIKISGIKSWGYDKLLVKSAIENILEAEKK